MYCGLMRDGNTKPPDLPLEKPICRSGRNSRTAAHQAPPSMGFSRQEYWSGVSLYTYKYAHKYTYIHLQAYIYNVLFSVSIISLFN